MKIFTRDIKGELKTAMRVAILTVAAIAGNSQTAQAGGRDGPLTQTAEAVGNVLESVLAPFRDLDRALRETRGDLAKIHYLKGSIESNLTVNAKSTSEIIGYGRDVYNRVAPKQSPRQELGDAIYPAPNENPSQTRGQGNDVAPQKQKDFDTAKEQLLEKMAKNEQNLAKLNGEGDKKTVDNTQTNKVSKRSTQGILTILAENFRSTE